LELEVRGREVEIPHRVIGIRISAVAIYREVAINNMIGTVEDAMRQVLDCWAELPQEMQDAVDEFRIQLGAAIDSVYLVKRALDQEVHENEMRLS
jgi:type IV secretory pathway ATPase VirB11/archaellum biosynthesis ATPase